ncbi:MAG: ATP-binding cassette domain-containing protein [Deltaproteobacteria bacterium]|nr:MAG: ATP-binding cassette domain-containing protein [Deltaproteobacteria bacterium]
MIRMENVSKAYPGGIQAVKNITLEVNEGEIIVLIGTSGCGKTTCLKMINRLIEPTLGKIVFRGQDIADMDPIQLRRGIGYVIQQVGLLPHMTVGKNVGIVPSLLKWDKELTQARVRETLSLVGLPPEEFESRYPNELSGGQQQRVGVARALAGDPESLLMDEPFGALDPITREGLQEEFSKIARSIGKTIVFVTHDIFEAFELGSRIAIMNDGCILQLDRPQAILERPASEFVEGFLRKHRAQLEKDLLGHQQRRPD